MATLRPYQLALKQDVLNAWDDGAQNVLMRLDTGGGKTVILSDIIQEHAGASAVIAHRQELVSQLSLALARNGVRHNIIGAQATRRAIAGEHMVEFGRSFFDPSARAAVASVDTLIRAKGLDGWAGQVTRWICDEGHHVVEDNKWHRAIELFKNPNVKGLLPTATPSRADGKGLGRWASGVADVMVQGPPMRWLIDQGYLTDYRMVLVESDMQLLETEIGAGGDWSTATLRAAAKKSHIVGDVVDEYLKWGAGKLGVTFTSDTETAAEITQAYIARGVRAALLTGKTEGGLRRQMLRQFAARQLDQLVVVDIVSEGFDLPAIEVISLARKTNSLATYMQQFGRSLRLLAGKERAIVIDHVGNFLRHGPPDRPRPWTLNDRERGARMEPGGIPLRVCIGRPKAEPPRPGCFQPFERTHDECPHCGAPLPEPVGRSSPDQVDGDMTELDAETLAAMRGAVDELDAPWEQYREQLVRQHCPPAGIMANVKRRVDQQAAQVLLRGAMAQWGGRRYAEGRSDREMQREFFHRFGLDVLSAMTISSKDAAELQARIEATP